MSAALLSIESALHWLTPIFGALKIYLTPVGSRKCKAPKANRIKAEKKGEDPAVVAYLPCVDHFDIEGTHTTSRPRI